VSNATNSPATVSLSGTGATLLLSVSPTSLAFGTVNVGSNSKQTVTLTNSGTASLIISQATVSGTGYSISGLTLPLTLAAGQTAPFSAALPPPPAGPTRRSTALVSNATNSPATASLSGTGAT